MNKLVMCSLRGENSITNDEATLHIEKTGSENNSYHLFIKLVFRSFTEETSRMLSWSI